MAADRAAYIALMDACTAIQQNIAPTTVGCSDSATSATPQHDAPTSTNGRRRPNRDLLRFDNAPTTGHATIATTDAVVLTSASAATFPAGSIRCTCAGNSTCVGVSVARYSPSAAAVNAPAHRIDTRPPDSSTPAASTD